jgi:hypothetical protein
MGEVASSAPVPWPSPDDDIFGSDGGPWRGVADVQGLWGEGAPPMVYAVGYREAAEVLVIRSTTSTSSVEGARVALGVALLRAEHRPRP